MNKIMKFKCLFNQKVYLEYLCYINKNEHKLLLNIDFIELHKNNFDINYDFSENSFMNTK